MPCPLGIDIGMRRELVVIVGVDGPVPVLVQLAQGPDLESEVIIVIESGQDAYVQSGLYVLFSVSGLEGGKGQEEREQRDNRFA